MMREAHPPAEHPCRCLSPHFAAPRSDWPPVKHAHAPFSLLVTSRMIFQVIKPLPVAYVGQAVARTEGTADDAWEHDADVTPNHPRRLPDR
jgi:hypothetical protein